MKRFLYFINRIAGWVYFKTTSEYTVKKTMISMEKEQFSPKFKIK